MNPEVMKPEEIPIETRVLEAAEAAIQHRIPDGEQHMYAAEVYQRVDHLLVEVRRYIYREQVAEEDRTVEFVYLEPASWWQMLKRDYLPWWVTRRWPVRHRALTVARKVPLKVYAEFPGYIAPIGSQFKEVTIREYPDRPVLNERNNQIRSQA